MSQNVRPKSHTCLQVQQIYSTLKRAKKKDFLKDKCKHVNNGEGCETRPIVDFFYREELTKIVDDMLSER